MTTEHPVMENDYSITIVDSSDLDRDDVMIIYGDNKVHIFRACASQYEYGYFEFIGTFTKGADLINKFVNKEFSVDDFITKIKEVNKCAN